MDNNELVMVTVNMAAYNHVKYIRQALESVLMQKVNFKYEIVITDDASNDGTADVIKEYADKYPDIIHSFCRKKNVGARKNFLYRITKAKGKYIADLECDDFWTDIYKLQKQVDFLEANPEYSLCFTDVYTITDSTVVYFNIHNDINSLDDYLTDGKSVPGIPTATTMRINIYKDNLELLNYYKKNRFVGDRITHTLFLKYGKYKYLPFKSACYRHIRKKGTSFSAMDEKVRLEDTIKCYNICMNMSPKRYGNLWNKLKSDLYNRLLKIIVKEEGIFQGFLYFLTNLSCIEKYYLLKEQWK